MPDHSDVYDASSATQITYADGQPETIQLRRLRLQVHPSRADSRTVEFDGDAVTVGSGPDNDLVVEDPTVSRRHCRILARGQSFVACDLDSTNGTFINGVRIREAYLDPGSVLAVGNSRIEFEPVDEELPVEPSDDHQFGQIVGTSVEMREIFDVLDKIAPTDATVVIEGETGTGKEVVAETLHEKSARADGPFVVFDCGAVPENLVESELFGHEKGSFTGAVVAREGLFQRAEGGTLFLDEIGELSLELQPKLLRVLEEREVRPVGANDTTPVDVRVVAATNRDLEEAVANETFREDLFYRLSVVRLSLPPLRDRTEDIPLLIRHFLAERDFNRDPEGERILRDVTDDALDALQDYHWPGNVRELENAVQRACSFTDSTRLGLEDLPDHISGLETSGSTADPPLCAGSAQEPEWTNLPPKSRLSDKPFKEAKEEWIAAFERDYLTDLLVRHDGNISQSAREADIDRKYFRQLMRDYELDPEDFE